jgi:hypothetical protein
MLLIPDLLPAEQLEGVEHLHSLADESTVAIFEPASDIEAQIIGAALSLDEGFETVAESVAHGGSFKVLTSPRVFDGLCAINPSIMAAIRSRFPLSPAPVAAPNEPAPAYVPSDDDLKREEEARALNRLPVYGAAVEQFHTRK